MQFFLTWYLTLILIFKDSRYKNYLKKKKSYSKWTSAVQFPVVGR